MSKFNVVLTLTEELLGTMTQNPNLFVEHIANQKPPGDPEADAIKIGQETRTVPVHLVEGTTGFHQEDGKPFLYDYVVKGFFKDACGSLRLVSDSLSKELTAHKKKIDGLIFVQPRQLFAVIPAGKEKGICTRPLRADTAQGPRVALANSETLPIGTTFSFELEVMDDGMDDTVVEWLDYGAKKGLGQWRNSGKGRFSYTIAAKAE